MLEGSCELLGFCQRAVDVYCYHSHYFLKRYIERGHLVGARRATGPRSWATLGTLQGILVGILWAWLSSPSGYVHVQRRRPTLAHRGHGVGTVGGRRLAVVHDFVGMA